MSNSDDVKVKFNYPEGPDRVPVCKCCGMTITDGKDRRHATIEDCFRAVVTRVAVLESENRGREEERRRIEQLLD